MLGDLPNEKNEKINPLVIFGAGASYDLANEHDNANFVKAEWRPPLTDNIFATNNNFFKKIQTEYGKNIDGLISEVRSRMRSGMNLEEVLTGVYKDEWEEDEENNEDVSLCWYLKVLFSEISDECINNVEGNNYSGFFRKLKRFCKNDEVFVVNFNYESRFEFLRTPTAYSEILILKYVGTILYPAPLWCWGYLACTDIGQYIGQYFFNNFVPFHHPSLPSSPRLHVGVLLGCACMYPFRIILILNILN